MTESDPLKNWELQENSDDNDQWQLLETEQELSPSLQLTPDPAGPAQGWQPVEQMEEERGGRGGWILPTFIIVAMLAVIGYIVWLGLGGFDLPPIATTDPTAPASDPAVAIADTPTVAPTATPLPEPTATLPPAPTPEPTQAMVEQEFATIASEYGLNARSAPNTESDIIILLEDGATYPVLSRDGAWLQIELDDGASGWIAADFAEITSQLVPAPADAPVAEEPAAAPPATAGGEAAVDEGGEAGDALRTTGITPPEPFSDIIPVGPAVIVQSEAGVNARSEPSTDGEILLTVPQGAALDAVGLSDDGAWANVLLPNDVRGWMFLDAVETSGDVTGLATSVEAAPAPDAATTITTTTALTTTASVDAEATATPIAETTLATAVIDNLLGMSARSAPSSTSDEVEFLDGATEWVVTGRTSDGLWVRLELTDGRAGWVLLGAVQLNVDPDEVEVVEP